MQDWKELVAKAKEDALRIYPALAASSPERQARQNRIDDLQFALQVTPGEPKLLTELLELNRERAADALTFDIK